MSAQSTKKVSVATVWLDGCSGCHMSFLDMDERLLELAAVIDIVYSPFVDNKTFPEQVDLTLVEGSVSSESEPLSAEKRSHMLTMLPEAREITLRAQVRLAPEVEQKGNILHRSS